VKTFGAAKVGIIGLTLEGTPSVTVEKAVAGLKFADEVKTVNALVPKLKSEGVSAIVVLVHQGGFQGPTGTYDSCADFTGDLVSILDGESASGTPALDPAVDVVVSAHTHQPYNCLRKGRLVTSAASFGRVVTQIDLAIDPTQQVVTKKSARNVVVTRDVAADPSVSSVIATFQSKAAPLANRVVGHVTGDITGSAITAASTSCETPLGDVIADAQLGATKSAGNGNAVIAFMNPGGIRTDLVHAASGTEGAGVVTYAEAFAVQPFANNLVTLTLTGAQIKTLLEQQFLPSKPRILQVSAGFEYTYDYDGAAKKGTVSAIKLGGAPIEPASTYRVTVNSFLADGGDGFSVLKAGTDRLSGIPDLDALVTHLEAHDPIAPPALTRINGNGCTN
jgi:5'-nucleotidase